MTSKHGESDKQKNAAEHEDRTTPQRHSQTLPLITEELAASRDATETERSSAPGQPATTPVMPPNPIRRETPGQDTPVLRQDTPAGVREASSTASTAAHPTDTRLAPAAANGPSPEDEKKSEGRISATQLLAGAGAAATSSVVGGQLGVAGTVVGASIASIITGLAVTIYGRSLDKGKEKIKEVGSKLAPAVKAQMAKGGQGAKAGTAQGVRSESVFASAPATDDTAATEAATAPAAVDEAGAAAETSQTWWQKLRRKRVLYPVTIGVAAFGIGLGAVVVAESVTGADISPGTSQISRAVSGNTGSGEETDGGSEGSSDSGSSGSGSQSGTDSNTGTANTGSSTSEGGATSAGEGESEGTSTGAQTDQGSDASSSDASSSTSSDGTDSSGASSTSNGSGSQGGSDASGSGSSSGGGAGGGSSSGGDSSAGGSGGSGASSAQG